MIAVANTVPASEEEKTALEQQGLMKCLNPRCDSFLDPEEQEAAWRANQYDCPRCLMSYRPRSIAPFAPDLEDGMWYDDVYPYSPGGRGYETLVGLTKDQMGKIGENVVGDLKTLGKYGDIEWWTPAYHGRLDGGTNAGWGIEVKAADSTMEDPRFIPGKKGDQERKIEHAIELGYTAILGILPILNFKESVADIYVREMQLGKWTYQDARGHTRTAVGMISFRPQSAFKLFTEVPFESPFLMPGEEPLPPPSQDIPF